jgi:hypothetical protein
MIETKAVTRALTSSSGATRPVWPVLRASGFSAAASSRGGAAADLGHGTVASLEQNLAVETVNHGVCFMKSGPDRICAGKYASCTRKGFLEIYSAAGRRAPISARRTGSNSASNQDYTSASHCCARGCGRGSPIAAPRRRRRHDLATTRRSRPASAANRMPAGRKADQHEADPGGARAAPPARPARIAARGISPWHRGRESRSLSV